MITASGSESFTLDRDYGGRAGEDIKKLTADFGRGMTGKFG